MAYQNDFMLIISAPDDFPSWTPAQKIHRYRQVLKWHAFVEELHEAGKMPWVWGGHQILSNYEPSGNSGTLVAIYRAESLSDYTQMMESDPLRDCSVYTTMPLASLQADWEEDVDALDQLTKSNAGTAAGHLFVEGLRSTQRDPPKYYDPDMGSVPLPVNAPCDFNKRESADDPIQYLLYGTGLKEGAEWSDVRRSMYTEKVKWWHAYNADMVRRGAVTHGWSTHIFCNSATAAVYRKGAAVVLEAESFDQLDELYGANPLLEEAEFISVALRPIASQRESDERRLVRALETYGDPG